MILGKKRTTILIVLMLIMVLIPLIQIPDILGDLSDPSSLIPHEPIFINKNSDFTKANGVVSGNGTELNPYIIENWSIDVKGSSHGIHINDTNAFFIIRNCYLYNGTAEPSQYNGIFLSEVSNGKITNNNVTYFHVGIYIFRSKYNKGQQLYIKQ